MAAEAPFISLALNGMGNPVIAFRSQDGALAILVCDDPACSGDESTNIAILDGQDSWDGSLVLNDEDTPVVAYIRGEDRQLREDERTRLRRAGILRPDE